MNLYFVVFGCVLFLAGYEGEICYETDTTISYCDSPYWCCSDNTACCGLSIRAWVGIAIGCVSLIVVIGGIIFYLITKHNRPGMVIQPQASTYSQAHQQPAVFYTQDQAVYPPQ